MTEAALILPTDVTRDGADWRCSQCGELTEAGQLNRRETEIATAMAGLPGPLSVSCLTLYSLTGLDNFKVVQFEKFHESLVHELHPNHYLMVLLKRHMVGLYSTVLTEMEAPDLERVSRCSQCHKDNKLFQGEKVLRGGGRCLPDNRPGIPERERDNPEGLV